MPHETFRFRWAELAVLQTALLVGLGGGGPPAHAQVDRRVEVEPPVRVTLRPDGGERLDGDLVHYSNTTLTVRTRDDATHNIAWEAIRSARVLWIFERVLPAEDARGWFDAAVMLFARDDGQAEAERAWRKAIAADASLAPLADGVRAGEVVAWPEAEQPEAQAGDDVPDPPGPGEPPVGAGSAQGEAPAPAAAANAGPQNVGELQAQFWGDLSPELMAASVETLKQEAQKVQDQMGIRLALYEDEHFLVYSDLPADEAKRWVGLLDDMYVRLIETFDLPAGRNVFRGKCLIYILQREADYLHLCAVGLGFNASGTAGVCQSRGDGFAVVAFYRQANTLDFAHVLVHESVHAFVHRYRSFPHIPSWVNEGLAEHIAHKLVQNRGFGRSNFASTQHDARRWLRYYGSMQGMFDARPISAWQYPVAGQLGSFMIAQSPKRYKAFIDALKDGKPWRDALREDYGITPEALAEAFGESIDVRNLKP